MLYQMFLNFFSYAPYGFSYFCLRSTTGAVRVKTVAPPLPKKAPDRALCTRIGAVRAFYSSDGRVVRVSVFGAVDLGLIPSRV